MAFIPNIVTSALTKYVDQLSSNLVPEIILSPRTNQYITVQEGVVYSSAINVLSNNVVFQAQACGNLLGAGGTGSTTLTQQVITVCPIMVEETMCLTGDNSIEQYWIAYGYNGGMRPGSTKKDLTPAAFAAEFVSAKMAKVSQDVELTEWLGNTAGTSTYSTNPNTYKCDGFLKLIDSTYSSQVVAFGGTANPGGFGTFSGAPTVDNAYELVQGMANAQIASIENISDEDDLTVFMSYANFRTYVSALVKKNWFNFTASEMGLDGTAPFSMKHPGTNITVLAVPGLKGSNRMLLTNAKNLVFGTDLLTDITNNYTFEYNSLIDGMILRLKWKQGVQIIRPSYVVNYKG